MLDLIRKAIRDIEVWNNFQLGEKSWIRLKQLDREIDQRVQQWGKEWSNAKPYDMLHDDVMARVFHRKDELGRWETYLLLDENYTDLQPLDRVRIRICKENEG